MSILWPAFVVGCVVIVTGVLLVTYRVRIRNFNAGLQKEVLGKAGEAAGAKTSNGTIGAVGVFAIIFGVILILIAFLYPAQTSSNRAVAGYSDVQGSDPLPLRT
jgi:hypothetical protein